MQQISFAQIKIIVSINDFRGIRYLHELKECNISQIPEFLINELSVVMMWPEQHIFKLSNKKYLFKFPTGQFEINFNNKDKNIISILLKKM